MEHGVCDLNYWAIAVAAIAAWIIGGIWWSKAIFGKVWAKAAGVGRKEMSPGPAKHVIWIVLQALTAFVLAIILTKFDAKDAAGALCGAFWVWAGFAIPILVSAVMFAKMKFKAFLIQAGFLLVSYTAMALIITLWQCGGK